MIRVYGGLTVLSELKKEMPNENYIYFGDTARVPYGSKSKETIIEYSRQIVNFLISKGVKIIVVACGTASSLAFETISKEFDVPIINVITPSAKIIKDKNIGVIATKATIKSGAWEKEILKHNKNAIISSKSCPLFVPIVEEGLADSKIADDVISLYLDTFKKKKVDSLVLGCTHYPILYSKIDRFFEKKVKLININKACAKEVQKYLSSHKLLNSNKNKKFTHAYTSDSTSNFKSNAKTFCDNEFDKVQKVVL